MRWLTCRCVTSSPDAVVQGEGASVLNSVDAVALCLSKPGGCAVVPGLTSDQYGFTLAVAVAAGLVAGAVSRLEPQGACMRRNRRQAHAFKSSTPDTHASEASFARS